MKSLTDLQDLAIRALRSRGDIWTSAQQLRDVCGYAFMNTTLHSLVSRGICERIHDTNHRPEVWRFRLLPGMTRDAINEKINRDRSQEEK